MQTYYQKHKTIQAWQFDGNWAKLFSIVGQQARVNLRNLPDVAKEINRPLLWYNSQRQITQLNYLTLSNAGLWSLDRIKKPHRRNHKRSRWIHEQNRLTKTMYHGNKRDATGKYTKEGNELRQAYVSDTYRPVYKYNEAFRPLYLGDYIVLGHRYLMMYDMSGAYKWHRVEFVKVWHRADFEAHWSTKSIK